MIKTVENLVPVPLQKEIENVFLDERMPWCFNLNTNYSVNGEKLQGDTFQFTNQVYDNLIPIPSPDLCELISPIIKAAETHFDFKIKQLISVKSNLLLNISNKSITHPPHADMIEPNFLSMVYYVTDSDGDTFLYDKFLYTARQPTPLSEYDNIQTVKKVSPVRGSAVVFESARLHSSSTPVANERRIVLNFIMKV